MDKRLPEWTNPLLHPYWMLRDRRNWDQAARRKWYRRIEKVKRALLDAGHDPEAVRLVCRSLANPKCAKARSRFFQYLAISDN